MDVIKEIEKRIGTIGRVERVDKIGNKYFVKTASGVVIEYDPEKDVIKANGKVIYSKKKDTSEQWGYTSATGKQITFDIPKKEKKIEIKYSPNVLDNSAQIIDRNPYASGDEKVLIVEKGKVREPTKEEKEKILKKYHKEVIKKIEQKEKPKGEIRPVPEEIKKGPVAKAISFIDEKVLKDVPPDTKEFAIGFLSGLLTTLASPYYFGKAITESIKQGNIRPLANLAKGVVEWFVQTGSRLYEAIFKGKHLKPHEVGELLGFLVAMKVPASIKVKGKTVNLDLTSASLGALSSIVKSPEFVKFASTVVKLKKKLKKKKKKGLTLSDLYKEYVKDLIEKSKNIDDIIKKLDDEIKKIDEAIKINKENLKKLRKAGKHDLANKVKRMIKEYEKIKRRLERLKKRLELNPTIVRRIRIKRIVKTKPKLIERLKLRYPIAKTIETTKTDQLLYALNIKLIQKLKEELKNKELTKTEFRQKIKEKVKEILQKVPKQKLIELVKTKKALKFEVPVKIQTKTGIKTKTIKIEVSPKFIRRILKSSSKTVSTSGKRKRKKYLDWRAILKTKFKKKRSY